MILIDGNLLIYAKVATYPQHKAAKAWLEEQFNSAIKVGIPWVSILSFLRICTSRKLFSRPLSVRQAWAQIDEWLALDHVWTPNPSDRHAERMHELIAEDSLNSALVYDVFLAALSIDYGLVLCSCDGDFARFNGLRWKNPLRESL